MTWEWGHALEAYANCRDNVAAKPRDWLVTVFAEWNSRRQLDDSFSMVKYNRALKKAALLPDEVLADEIWNKMIEQRNCTNGGSYAHACPFGCGCHLVSFSKEGTANE